MCPRARMYRNSDSSSNRKLATQPRSRRHEQATDYKITACNNPNKSAMNNTLCALRLHACFHHVCARAGIRDSEGDAEPGRRRRGTHLHTSASNPLSPPVCVFVCGGRGNSAPS
eukprot:14815464-Alexandrium_andersonii.AAC.1